MDYLAYLFLNHLNLVAEETRFIDGQEQVCLVIPTSTNQIKRGKDGNWLMTLRLTAQDANAKNRTHIMQLGFLNWDEVDKARLHGWYERSQRIGHVYEHDRSPEKKVSRENLSQDINLAGEIILSDLPRKKITSNPMTGKRYIDNLRLKPMRMQDVIYTGLICIDDIPRQCIKTNPDTGKRMIRTRFAKSQYLDTYMNTHLLYAVADDGTEIEIGRFREWIKDESSANHPSEHTTINPSPSIRVDGIKF